MATLLYTVLLMALFGSALSFGLRSSKVSFARSFLSMLKVGDVAPDFELPTADGKKFKLSSYKGKAPIVAFYYPADSTPGCTKEACQFELDGPKFKKLGATVIGISSGGADSKKKFASENSLSMPLLIDAGDKVRTLWGVPKALFGALPGRVTYVLDKSGKVISITDDLVNTSKHVEESLKALSK